MGYIGTHLQTEGTVYIVGGQGAIGSDFDSYLTNKGYNVVRLGGVDRYATNRITVDALNSATGRIEGSYPTQWETILKI